MLLQDLFRVSTDDTWVTVVIGDTVFKTCYNGLLTDISATLLDAHINTIIAIDLNYLLITIA